MKEKRHIIAYTHKTGGLNKSNTLEGIASSLTVDRDGELILPSAFENSIPAYLEKNPVMLWNHDPAEPIGKVTQMTVEGNDVPFKAEFADTDKAKEIRSLYRAGVLNAVSVGFKPLDWSDDPKDKLKGQSGVTITDLELYELSAVAIPANADALARIKQASLGVLGDVSGYKWAEQLKETPEEPEAEQLLAISLTDDDLFNEVTKRLSTILADEVPSDIAKHLACLRLQLLPVLGEPSNCNHQGNNPDLLDNLGLDNALNQLRNSNNQ